MTGIAISLILGGALALFLIPVLARHSKLAAFCAMPVLPVCTLAIYMTFIAPPPTASVTTLAFLEASYKAQPDNLTKALDLAGYYIEKDAYDKSLAILDEAETYHPGHQDIALQRASAIFARGLHAAENKEYDAALSSLWEARKVAPDNAPFAEDLDNFITIISRAHDESQGRTFNEDDEETE